MVYTDTGQGPASYVGVGGVARKIKNIYVGVNGVARRVTKGYVGKNKSTISGAYYDSIPDNEQNLARLWYAPALNAMTWDEIKTISSAGKGANYWAIGDRKAVTLNGTVSGVTFSNYPTYAFIIGFNHNSALEGNKRTHFQLAKTALTGGADICFVSSNYNTASQTTGFIMNNTRTNAGGWASSYMRNNICGTSKTSYSGKFIGVLPSDLRSVLTSVTKYTDNTGGGSTAEENVTATTDYVFLLADYEVFGTAYQVNPYEADKQAQYTYYAAGNSKIKYQHTATTTAAICFSRSPYCNGTNSLSFKAVTATGTTGGNYYANTPRGIAPCFCV